MSQIRHWYLLLMLLHCLVVYGSDRESIYQKLIELADCGGQSARPPEVLQGSESTAGAGTSSSLGVVKSSLTSREYRTVMTKL